MDIKSSVATCKYFGGQIYAIIYKETLVAYDYIFIKKILTLDFRKNPIEFSSNWFGLDIKLPVATCRYFGGLILS